jgi:V/A-type H+-transporting ATPase subunit I
MNLKPLPMQRIELSLLQDDAPKAALLLANFGNFSPESSEMSPEQFPDSTGDVYQLAYREMRAHLDKIQMHYEIIEPDTIPEPMQTVSAQQFEEISIWLKTVWGNCSEEQERMRRLREEFRRTTQLLSSLEQFMDINLDLSLLQKNTLLDVRVGTLLHSNIQRFEEALSLAGYIAIRFFTSEEQIHIIIAGVTGQAHEIEHVLDAAGWRTMEIPAEFHGRPAEVRQELANHLTHLTEQQTQESGHRRTELIQIEAKLVNAAHILARAAPYAALATLIRGRGELVSLSGWVPACQLPKLKKMLKDSFADHFLLLVRDPHDDEYVQVPSMIRHHRWLQPFARLVLNYGVPRYGEIDPTIPFAITFVLMFGMMFGDVGHGATLLLAGILLRHRFGQYTMIFIAIGLSSTLFGLLYGSVFGFEQLLPAVWISPLSDPMRMLGVALGWGIGFITLVTLLTIRNRIVDKRLKEAWLDGHGAAGLLLYAGLLSMAWRYVATGRLEIAALLIMIIALAALFVHSWQNSTLVGTGERILIALMAGYESIMAYISNTLSFLRLAAFSLNHVALSIAIFTVAGRLHTGGYWITVILGNLFILLLEGAIVGIQTLRLEYYEGFSRFFAGDGRAFRPLTLIGSLAKF